MQNGVVLSDQALVHHGMTFLEGRAQFPVLQRIAYLNAGTFGPLATATDGDLDRLLDALPA